MVRRSIAALCSFLGPVLRDQRGVAAVFLAVALIPLIGAVGLAVDSSLGYLLKTRMGKSLDTAGLAAGRIALDANAATVARQYFDANFGKSNPSVTLTSFKFEVDPTFHYVTLSATATTPTLFMRVLGHDTMTVGARSVDRARDHRHGAGPRPRQYRLDVRRGLHLTSERRQRPGRHHLRRQERGRQPLGQRRALRLDGEHRPDPHRLARHRRPRADQYRQLLDRRLEGLRDGPGHALRRRRHADRSQKLTSFFNPATTSTSDNNWPTIKTSIADQNKGTSSDENTARGPNLGCGSPITSLTPNKTTVKTALKAMGPVHRGGTTGNLGLTWGWRTLSPRWRGAWGGETPAKLPLDYKTPSMDKVAVILTDGNNAFHDNDTSTANNSVPASDFTGYGRIEALNGNSNGTAQARRDAGRATLDSRMATTCTAMKAQGILIYTIIFGAAPDATAKTLFTNCATTPATYYYAPTNAALSTAFRAIGGQLANLRIVE